MRFLLLIVGLFLLFSCRKDKVSPASQKDNVYITEILSVRCSNSSTDSSWIYLDTIEKSFSPPIKEFDTYDFSKILDSIHLKLDPIDNLHFKKPVPLPAVVIDNFTRLNTDSDSISIDAFETDTGFRSATHWDVSQRITGLINKYRLTGKYKRVYYNVDVKVDARDNTGSVWTLKGKLKGSKVTEPYTGVTVW